MPITHEKFSKWIRALSDRYPNQSINQTAKGVYWNKLFNRFDNDLQFEQVMIEVYAKEHVRFPAVETILAIKKEYLQQKAQELPEGQNRTALPWDNAKPCPPPPWLGQAMWLQRKLKRQGIVMRFLGDGVWEIQCKESIQQIDVSIDVSVEQQAESGSWITVPDSTTVQITWNGSGWECSPQSFTPKLQQLLKERHAERQALREQRDQLTSMADQLTASGL